jgi:hypothetical protein
MEWSPWQRLPVQNTPLRECVRTLPSILKELKQKITSECLVEAVFYQNHGLIQDFENRGRSNKKTALVSDSSDRIARVDIQ